MAHKMGEKAVSENSIGDPLHKPAKKKKKELDQYSPDKLVQWSIYYNDSILSDKLMRLRDPFSAREQTRVERIRICLRFTRLFCEH